MNTSTQAKKIYSKLEPTEQAALMVQAAALGNWAEADIIASQVTRKTYDCVDQIYHRRVISLQLLAGRFGLEHWKSMTALFFFAGKGDADSVAKAKTKIVSVHAGLDAACATLHVDPDALRKLAGGCNTPSIDLRDVQPDAALVNAMTEELLTHVLA